MLISHTVTSSWVLVIYLKACVGLSGLQLSPGVLEASKAQRKPLADCLVLGFNIWLAIADQHTVQLSGSGMYTIQTHLCYVTDKLVSITQGAHVTLMANALHFY